MAVPENDTTNKNREKEKKGRGGGIKGRSNRSEGKTLIYQNQMGRDQQLITEKDKTDALF